MNIKKRKVEASWLVALQAHSKVDKYSLIASKLFLSI